MAGFLNRGGNFPRRALLLVCHVITRPGSRHATFILARVTWVRACPLGELNWGFVYFILGALEAWIPVCVGRWKRINTLWMFGNSDSIPPGAHRVHGDHLRLEEEEEKQPEAKAKPSASSSSTGRSSKMRFDPSGPHAFIEEALS
ncbi:hypothetical protein NL676_019388 [Syzygium grande]|nr:hypothetical protein NL676_019388 [Syzygium grande]